MRKKTILSAVISVALTLQAALPCAGAEAKAEDIDQVGKISICSDYAGKTEWDAALHNDRLILMTPEDIGEISGAQVSYDAADHVYTFKRGSYSVEVDTHKAEAQVIVWLYRMNGADVILTPYGGRFSLEYVTEIEVAGEARTFLPLEQMMYLLNVQWDCVDGCVYTVAPKETLWNVVGSIIASVSLGDLPRKEDIFGEGLNFWGNVSYYSIMSCADELTVLSFVPGNDGRYLNGKMKEALLRLSVPCKITEGERSLALELGQSLSDPADLLNNASSVAGGVSSGLDLLKKFFPWLESMDVDLEIPGLDVAGPVLTSVTKGIDLVMTASRHKSWDEEYIGELGYLSRLEDKANNYKRIKKAAGELYKEESASDGNLAQGYIGIARDVILDELATGCTVGGKVLAAYNAMIAMADANSPAFAYNLDLADAAALANSLTEVSNLMWHQYDKELKKLGSGDLTLSQLKDIRYSGSLTIASAAHVWGILTEPVLSDNSSRADGGQRSRCFTTAARLAESVQYDQLLFLYKDYRNIHMEIPGAMRCEIPPEYVRFGVPLLCLSNMAEYNGTMYIVGIGEEKKSLLAEKGVIALEIKPALYDYISSFTFYRGMLYYICKDAGFSGYRSALCRCRPDGSEQTVLAADSAVLALNRFYIQDNRIYFDGGADYYDLLTDERVTTEYAYVLGMGTIQYNSKYRFLSQEDGIYQSEYGPGEDGIMRYWDIKLVVPFDRAYQGTIHAATEKFVYYTMRVDQYGYLYRYDIETGIITELDSCPITSEYVVDSYFNW